MTPKLKKLLHSHKELTDAETRYLQDLLENPTEETHWYKNMIQRRLRGEPATNCGMTWEDVEETDEILRELGMN